MTRRRENCPAPTNARHPFVSPDGQWVGFFVGPELRKVPVRAAAPVTDLPHRRRPARSQLG